MLDYLHMGLSPQAKAEVQAHFRAIASRGGKARAKNLTAQELSAIGKKAAQAKKRKRQTVAE